NGSLGSTEHSREEIIDIRAAESRKAAEYLGAAWYPSLFDDMEVIYTIENVTRVASIVRKARPHIMLVASPQDYMEDHMQACRLAVSAAFVRGMPNYRTTPPTEPYLDDVVLYHAMPHGVTGPLEGTIIPDFYVNVGEVIQEKENMLACHKSQKSWLDATQGMDSYLQTMRDLARTVGTMSGTYEYAEGWRRHSLRGYSTVEQDPLRRLLKDYICDS
ncbi:MAG: PIG-L deacetylase family protein, partial [Spirochaetaceae bacterium]